jgi:PEP-CTERM motif
MSINHGAFKFPVQFTGRRAFLLFLTFIGVQSALSAHSEAAKLNRYLTSEDVAGRMILDQKGEQIPLPTAGDRHPAHSSGSIPTYLAIPLKGGEQLPGSIPTLDTGSQPGQQPAGPLNFDSVVKANLDAMLSTSRLAVVDASTGNYLVEFLPVRGHSSSQNAVGGAGSTFSDLVNLLGTPQKQINKLTAGDMSELDKLLHISSKSSTLIPSLNLEAQVLGAEVLPAAAPEPSTWLLFLGFAAGACILRRRRLAGM